MSITVPPGRHWAIVSLASLNGEVDPNATIGFDAPMRTHFFQTGVERADDEGPLVWLGTEPGEHPTFDDLRAAMERAGITIVEWELEPKPEANQRSQELELHIAALEEAIRFSNHVPQREAMRFSLSRLRDDLASVSSVRNSTLDAGLAALRLPFGGTSKKRREAMTAVLDAMASDIAERANILAAQASYGIRPEIIAFAHVLEDAARRNGDRQPFELGASAAAAAQSVRDLVHTQALKAEVSPALSRELLKPLVSATLAGIGLINANGHLPAPDYAQLAQSHRDEKTARRHRECLEDISHLLELPASESGPCDDPKVYTQSIECLLDDNAQLDKERVAHAQARFIAEAELHQYKAVGRQPISAAYPNDAVIERLQMVSRALFPDQNVDSSEIVFAGDVGNWAWLLNQLSAAELSAQLISPLTLLAQVRAAIAPVADYVLRNDKRPLTGLADDFRPLRPLTAKSLRQIAEISEHLDANMVDPSGLVPATRQVHAVCRRSGDYDEADETFIAAYFDQATADAHAQTAQIWWDREIEPLRNTISAGPDGAAQAKQFYNKAGESPFDPGGLGTNQRYYSVQTIDIDLVPPAGVLPIAKNEIEDSPDV